VTSTSNALASAWIPVGGAGGSAGGSSVSEALAVGDTLAAGDMLGAADRSSGSFQIMSRRMTPRINRAAMITAARGTRRPGSSFDPVPSVGVSGGPDGDADTGSEFDPEVGSDAGPGVCSDVFSGGG
jgi:hypothetical protein